VPYIITVTEPANADASDVWKDRTAVATLDEARKAAYAAIGENDNPPYFDGHFAVDSLEADGGTVGPLPDGTVIEVAPATWADLVDTLVNSMDDAPIEADDIIAAFNAR